MKEKIINKIKYIDQWIVLITVLCVVFGIIAINSAVSSYQSSISFVIIQSVSALIGFIIMITLACTNYTKLTKITN